jgi:hypothetical protein
MLYQYGSAFEELTRSHNIACNQHTHCLSCTGPHNRCPCFMSLTSHTRCPACSCRQGQLPFYLPPESFIHTHLPFEAYWQLLPNPVSLEQWWQMPEVSLALCAVGGQLVAEGQLKSCNMLPAVRCAVHQACGVMHTVRNEHAGHGLYLTIHRTL